MFCNRSRCDLSCKFCLILRKSLSLLIHGVSVVIKNLNQDGLIFDTELLGFDLPEESS